MSRKIIPITYTIVSVLALCLIPISYAEKTNDKVSHDDIKEDTKALISTLQQYGVEQRDEAIHQAEIALDKMDAEIERLETRIDKNWEEMSEKAREKSRSTLKTLRAQRIRVAESYGSFKTSSSEAWEEIKIGFSAAYDELSNSWEKVKAEYDTDNQSDSKAKADAETKGTAEDKE